MKHLMLGLIFALSVNSASATTVNISTLQNSNFLGGNTITAYEFEQSSSFEDIYNFSVSEDQLNMPFILAATSNRVYSSFSDGSFYNLNNIINLNYRLFNSENNEISSSIDSLNPGNYFVKVTGTVSEAFTGTYRIFIGMGEGVSESFESMKDSFYLPDVDMNIDVGNFPTPSVPEPDTYSTMGLGLALIGLISYRRRKSHS